MCRKLKGVFTAHRRVKKKKKERREEEALKLGGSSPWDSVNSPRAGNVFRAGGGGAKAILFRGEPRVRARACAHEREREG